VIGRGNHLHEERLFDCYVAAKGGEVLDPRDAEHLTDCDECGNRYAALSEFMEMLSTHATAESDVVFSPERLRAQRAHVSRRLEHVGHPARVITFPGRTASHHFGVSTPRPGRRWVAAAAAAGLFVGVATGLFLDHEGRGSGRRTSLATARQTVLTAPVLRVEPGRVDARIELVRPRPFESDEAFLSELELAGERPRIRELTAVDALTPHVREVNLR
jgi:hypothetical protein